MGNRIASSRKIAVSENEQVVFACGQAIYYKKDLEIKYKSQCHQLTNVKINISEKKLTIHRIRQLKCDDTYMLQLTRIKIFIKIIVKKICSRSSKIPM